MEWYVIDAIIAFVAGFAGGLCSEGARKMFAPYILRSKIRFGKIAKSEPAEERYFPYWYAPISVRANPLWNLIASRIDDVKANIDFISRNSGKTLSYRATWADLGDAVLAQFGIGSELKLRIATLSNGVIAVDSIDQRDVLNGDYDISIELKSGGKSLGHWRYSKAIMNGEVQLVESDDAEVSNATS